MAVSLEGDDAYIVDGILGSHISENREQFSGTRQESRHDFFSGSLRFRD